MSSTIGTLFKVSTFGESHGKAVGAIVDGCPANLKLSEADIQPQLTRRRPGQSDMTTPRDEADRVIILSGVENGKTMGTPIGLMVNNRDQRPGDYGEMSNIPRPSHADYTYQMKYGNRASSGGGRSSARETIGRVAAGAIAEKWLSEQFGIRITSWVSSVGDIDARDMTAESLTREQVELFERWITAGAPWTLIFADVKNLVQSGVESSGFKHIHQFIHQSENDLVHLRV